MASSQLTRNITRVFRAATDEQIAAGVKWYADALKISQTLAARHNVTLAQSVGIIAALSPQNSWGANVKLAGRFMASGGLTSGYMRANLAKAARILAGESPDEVLGGLKVRNFYASILSGGREGVCVDRHAYSLAVNDRSVSNSMPSLTPKRYAEVSDAYVRAARILAREYGEHVTPAVVQSVTWVVWRARYWSAGAFDSHDVALAA